MVCNLKCQKSALGLRQTLKVITFNTPKVPALPLQTEKRPPAHVDEAARICPSAELQTGYLVLSEFDSKEQ